jgi:D-threo-aldose 1-dehydrogenase
MIDAAHWPRLGLGCASLGTPPPALCDRDAVDVMSAAFARGVRFFDVAPLYGGGLAEQRLGTALRDRPREALVLCTKTGVTRPLGESAMPAGATRRREFDVWDYSAKATRISVEKSLARLGVARLDVVHLHDVEAHLDACIEAYEELERMRDEGLVGAIGVGSNLIEPVQKLLARVDLDAVLLAGCYTLLDQHASTFFDDAYRKGIRIIAGGIFNSGVLAKWPQPAPTYGYEPADAAIVARTARIASVCERHGVALGTAALQFVLAHPAITTVLIGPRSVQELDDTLQALRRPIPNTLWDDLESASLIARGSPRPAANMSALVS